MFLIVCRESRRAPNDAAEIALYKRNSCAFHRDVRAGPHRDADVRGRQGRGVIDSVAGHGHLAPLRLQAFDLGNLGLGRDFRQDLLNLNADFARDRVRGGRTVACQHDDADAIGSQRANGFDRGQFDGIGDAEQTAARPSTATNITVCPS
jgi:hypothetical protein